MLMEQSKLLLFLVLCLLIGKSNYMLHAQTAQSSLPIEFSTSQLDFEKFIAMVKENHPIAKQAGIVMETGRATVLKARGNFDPKIVGDKRIKEFQGKKYYDNNQLTFKIPTWYGISLEGGFYRNEGNYLNRADIIPNDGLYAAGVSIDLLQGSWINERMATLKMAKAFQKQTLAEREIILNNLLYEAALSYFNWLKEQQNYAAVLAVTQTARERYKGIQQLVNEGERAAIDSIEAKALIQDREMTLLKTQIALNSSKLKVSNFLWSENEIPLELMDETAAEAVDHIGLDFGLMQLKDSLDRIELKNNPKLKALNAKVEQLAIDKNLKINGLLPKLKLNYNLINEQPIQNTPLDIGQYKGGLSFSMPLFLRKERGALRLAKLKLSDARYTYDLENIKLKNKLRELFFKWQNNQEILTVSNEVVKANKKLLKAEERKFYLGESSLFMVNSREQKYLSVQLKRNESLNQLLTTKVTLLNTLMLPIIN